MELGNSVVKTPEAETETPNRIPPPPLAAKPSPFTNGVLKRHPPLHLHHHPVVVTYRECLKNHAASIGGHAVDGCREFMPSPTSNPAEPTTLKCAACGCHRNFHRRDPDETLRLQLPPPSSAPALEYQPYHRHHPLPPPRGNSGSSPNDSPSPPPISSSYYPSAPHMLLALSHGLSAPYPDGNIPVPGGISAASTPASNSSHRKRFRTKFTQNQKDKMQEFAEKIGWKMQKKDDDQITQFCTEIGVDRGVFKVWMHNNKYAASKKDPPPPLLQISAATNGNAEDYHNPTSAAYRRLSEGNIDIQQSSRDHEMSKIQLHKNTTDAHGTPGSSST